LAPIAATLVIDRLSILVPVRRFPGMGAFDSHSLRYYSYVRMHHFVRRSTYVPSRRFDLGEFLQRLYSIALYDTFGSYLRDALQEGSVDAVACLPTLFSLFAWWFPLLFLVKKKYIRI
jgi:hypothetical protein